jgi:hypothetical protein
MIGQTYTVSNAEKKSVVEVIEMRNQNHPDVVLRIEEVYRAGEWDITPTNEEEVSRLLEHDEDEDFEPTTFADFEFVELFDCHSRDVEIHGFSQERYNELENETDYFDQSTLQDLGWYEDEVETLVIGPINVEKQ